MQYSVDIDLNNLDEESIRYPALFDLFQREEAKWSAKWDDLKDKLSVLKADVNLLVRGWDVKEMNSFFGIKIDKATEDVYKQLSLIHPEVISLMNEIIDARYHLKIYEAA